MTADRPVYVCCRDSSRRHGLVDALRPLGLRARGFASAAVLANAARAQPPGAVVLEWQADAAGLMATLPEHTARICLVRDHALDPALAASAAGADAVVDADIAPAALRGLVAALGGAGAPVIAIVDEHGDGGTLADALRAAGGTVHCLAAGEALIPDLLAAAPALILLRSRSARRLARLIEQTPGLAGAEVRPVDETPAGTLRQRAAALQQRHAVAAAAVLHEPRGGALSAPHLPALAASVRERSAQRGELAAVVALRVSPGATGEAVALLQAELPALAAVAVLAGDVAAAVTTGTDEDAIDRQLGDVQRAAAERLPGAVVGHARLDGPLPEPEALFSGTTDTPRGAGTEAADADAALDRRIREAIEDDALRLVYQPISSLSGHPGNFFEVFVRLADGSGDELPPDFVRVACAGGHAPALDRAILERALEVLATHDANGPTLFVKLFAETLDDPELPAWLAGRLRDRGVAAARLVLQLSHPTLCARRAAVEPRMRELRALGCGLAVEHFDDRLEQGETLSGPAIDYLKLSHRLTDDLIQHAGRVARIREIARAARDSEVRTIACLVQDAANLSVLWQAGVAYIQGYFMQAPEAIFASAPEDR